MNWVQENKFLAGFVGVMVIMVCLAFAVTLNAPIPDRAQFGLFRM